MKEIQIGINEEGQRLTKLLEKYMKLAPKSFFFKMLRKKNITLNGKKAEGKEMLKQGDVIRLFLSDDTIEKFQASTEEKKKEDFKSTARNNLIKVAFENDHVLIVDKPAGILSQKSEKQDFSVVDWVEGYLEKERMSEEIFKPGICSRLDRNTSGLITAGKSLYALQILNQWMKERKIEKYYECIVKGTIKQEVLVEGYLKKDKCTNKVEISSKKREGWEYIKTGYKPLEIFKGVTRLEVHLYTGKSHQIRAHLASIGHPLAGDFKYGDKNWNRELKKYTGLSHHLLHACRLEFPEDTGRLNMDQTTVLSEPPESFQRVWKYLNGKEME